MIILERLCVLALHLSLVLQIATRSALAASPRPNDARLDALEDFLLAIPDRLSYELNPGLFKRAPQATETGGGGGATGGGGGATGGATGGGGGAPTGGGGGPTQPDPTTAPPATTDNTGPPGGTTPLPDTTGPGQGGNESASSSNDSSNPTNNSDTSSPSNPPPITTPSTTATATDPPSSTPPSDPPNTSTTLPPNVDSSSSSNTSSPTSTPTDTSPTVSASATGSDGSASATGTGSDTTGDSSISTGGSAGLPPTSTGDATDNTASGSQTGSATDGGTAGGGTTPSGTGTGTADGTETSTSVPVSTSIGVSTGEDGPHLVTYGSWVGGSYYSYNPATETSTSNAPAQTPWVEQTVPPSEPPPPGCSVDYYPADGWETTGSAGGAAASSSVDGSNPAGGQGTGLCNNGTKVAKKPGAKIELTFIGVEAQLQFVPSQIGGQYSIQLDDEEPLTFDSYKPDLTRCEYTVPWHRTNLDNKPHNVTIIVKGASDQVPSSSVGTISASQVEFGGLVYKGPPTKKKKSNTPIIIGAAAGAAVLLIAIALIAYFIVRRRRRQRQADVDTAPFPGPAMSTISSPRPGYTPALPSSLAATPTPTFGETASIAPSQRPPSKVQSAFEQQYAQMHGHSHSHSRSMSDASMQVPQDPKMSWYGYEPPPPAGQPVQGFAFSNHGSPQSSPPTSPPRRPMQFMPMSGAEYDQQNPFQTQAEYGMAQQSQQQGHMRGVSQATSNGKNPFE